MIKEELYHKTANILVDAYFNDTLEHGKCGACAVGNLCKRVKDRKAPVTAWKGFFFTDQNGEQQFDYYDHFEAWSTNERQNTLDMIKGTGYNISELAKIEHAFETADYGSGKDEWMFNGLMAVIDVLDEIHQNNDTALTTSTKNKFSKQPA